MYLTTYILLRNININYHTFGLIVIVEKND